MILKRLKYAAMAATLALPAVVCAQQGGGSSGPPLPAEAAARVGDRVITMKEVDDAWRQADPVEHTRATQQLYEGRRQTLDRMIADMLIEQAAKAKGIAPEQYAKDETAKRIKPVTDAEITTFYEQNKARMQGKPLEAMRAAIRDYLEKQREAAARDSLVAELRKSGPAIRVGIDPPRQTVAVSPTDPARGGAQAAVVIVEFSDYQ
jgi:SurA N-terminal domain